MNRFVKSTNALLSGEKLQHYQKGVALYDGNVVTSYIGGDLQLTSHRLIWSNSEASLALDLNLIVFVEEEPGSWTKSNKIVVHLNKPPDNHVGVQAGSSFNFIKCSFRSGGASEFFVSLAETLEKKEWLRLLLGDQKRRVRGGIREIEDSLHSEAMQNKQTIEAAFKDLKQLMTMAQDMVQLSKAISQKIREQSAEITDDETIQFKSHLLSLGIADPVTRSSHGSAFHRELAKEIATVLEGPIRECGGVMALTDVFCRINRARGINLLSPDDLMEACQEINSLSLPLRFHTFESGVTVLQLTELNDDTVAHETRTLVEDHCCLTAEELASLINIPVILCLERLFAAERLALLCRDDTVEGLRFYTNKFLMPQDEDTINI